MSLQVSIATGSPLPIYRQIADQIRRAVATRQLLPGEQLPSVRALAEDLVINPNTVARTYADLIRDGVLEAQKAKGVYVALATLDQVSERMPPSSTIPAVQATTKAAIVRSDCPRIHAAA